MGTTGKRGRLLVTDARFRMTGSEFALTDNGSTSPARCLPLRGTAFRNRRASPFRDMAAIPIQHANQIACAPALPLNGVRAVARDGGGQLRTARRA